ncbi:arylamine N-acetyltransferase family protein [Nocardia carnea]|uniref:arylamine N-acetyltransferase family protein n=1 Tax=Nocardia carnea TaxID=37328 RepID=UPI002456E5C2|nr:arylamine N-acetyltransferase [Nocardia carnea]
MTSTAWRSETLDLTAYLEYLGVPRRRPGRAALTELYLAHLRAFTFDNIDVLLGRHPGVDLSAVQDKFLGRGRGGYCFEHATLFAAALEQLGYPVVRRLGRVGDPAGSARTHMVVEVEVDGRRLLADPGFGFSLLRPIPMRHLAQDTVAGATFRIVRSADAHGASWELQRLRRSGWERMHTTDECTVLPADIAVGHHYTSTHPDSVFRRMLVVARFLADGRHVTLTHNAVTIRKPGAGTVHRSLQPGEFDIRLGELGAALTPGEAGRLAERRTALNAGASSSVALDHTPDHS